MHNQKGLTIIEVLLASTLMLMILGSVFLMIINFSSVSRTEDARVRLQQESRFLMATFSSDLKNAGAVLTLAHTGKFLEGKNPYFNGIFPINSTNSPDGIIIASGDPFAVTKLTDATGLVPTSKTDYAVDDMTATPAWAAGDRGILLSEDGYYVFRVESVDVSNKTISVRNTPVYFSGLMQTSNPIYYDPPNQSGQTGDNVTYPKGAPVVRLTNFSIYLIDKNGDLVSITDVASNDTDILSSSQVQKGVIAENIMDMQIIYVAYPNFPDTTGKVEYFSAQGSSDQNALLTHLQSRVLKEIFIDFVALTDEYSGRGEISYRIPATDAAIGDRPAYYSPTGKYSYKQFRVQIEPRNYNIAL